MQIYFITCHFIHSLNITSYTIISGETNMIISKTKKHLQSEIQGWYDCKAHRQ